MSEANDSSPASGSADPFEGLPDDYPCRTCGDPDDFTHGLERCDDQPCDELNEWKRKQGRWGMNQKYIKFKRTKTDENHWLVLTNHGDCLGQVYYYTPWKQYVIEPAHNTVWSAGCLQQVIDFLKEPKP